MFDNLSRRLQDIFRNLSRKGRLTEADVDAVLREVRLALLEADVNFRVVKEFVARVRERAIGADILHSLTPAQQVVKIVHEEMVSMLGAPGRLNLSGRPPHVVMLVGLQGSGKTTTAAKLALALRKSGQRPLLVAADPRRPAAVTQLQVLGQVLDIPVHTESVEIDPAETCARAVEHARQSAHSVVLLDTGGRLHIDDALMEELVRIKQRVSPVEVVLVADAMTGQDAVRVADDFNKRVGLTGLILTKVDGDARGGAALSMRAVTGVPIKYLGVGEKTDALEPFQPDRLASRILGMGDMLTLIERAEAAFDEEQARRLQEKLATADFDLEDFREQLRQVKQMGPLHQVLEMIPGFTQMSRELPQHVTDQQMRRIEAIINSMTPEERRNPRIIGGSRKKRIARGSGTTIQDVNQLLGQFRQMQRLMKQIRDGRSRGFLSLFR